MINSREMIDFINLIDNYDELEQIIQTVRFRHDEIRKKATSMLNIGDKVMFRTRRAKREGQVVITVDKIYRGKVYGKTASGIQWKVSSVLCKKISK